MGIESDQLVYDYLSRVGDLAQRQLSSGDRMRLVSSLRGEIDRQRARPDSDGAGAVLRILGRLGTPAEQVAAAVNGVPIGPATTARAEAAPATGERPRRVPRPRRTEKDEPPPRRATALPPHLAGEDELGPSGSGPDWWRVDSSPFGPGDSVPGFTGGVEIPEILRPPAAERAAAADDEEEFDDDVGDPVVEDRSPQRRLGLRRRLPVAVRTAVATRTSFSPFLLLAAVVLVIGAVLGNVIVLAVGWLLAYSSRRLTRTEAKWAVLGLPGLAVAGGLVWLWGRGNGHWGAPIAAHGMDEAISGVWPVVLRAAAGATALHLIWRARRRGQGRAPRR